MRLIRFALPLCLAVSAVAGVFGETPGKTLKVSFVNANPATLAGVTKAADCNLIPGHNSSFVPYGVPAASLLTTDGAVSSWGVTFADEVGGSGAALTVTDAKVGEVFPLAKVSGVPNGCPLQGASNASLTFNGVTPGQPYALTVLAGRGNAWNDTTTVYSVDGVPLADAEVLAQSGAGATPSGGMVTADVRSGRWALLRFVTRANADTLTLSATGGSGNIGAVALEALDPAAWMAMSWSKAGDGVWDEAANWANFSASGEAEALLPELAGCTEVTIEASAAKARTVRCVSDATVYVLAHLPDAAGAVASSGRLVLEGRDAYGNDLSGTAIRVVGETALSGALAAPVTVTAAALTLRGTASDVTVEGDGTLGGDGHVSGRLAFVSGAVLDAAKGTLVAGDVVAKTAELLDKSLPAGETYENSATVSVRVGSGVSGKVLGYASCSGVRFVLAAGAVGTLDARADGLYYTPAPGYCLRLR